MACRTSPMTMLFWSLFFVFEIPAAVGDTSPSAVRKENEALVELITKLGWTTVTVIATSESDDSLVELIVRELHARHVRLIIVTENHEARFSHLATRGPGIENGTDDETNSGTPCGTEIAPQGGQEERDKIGSELLRHADDDCESKRRITLSQDTFNESSESSSDSKTRYADRDASLQNETEKEDSLLHSTVNISSNFLVLGSFRFVKRIFQRVASILKANRQQYKLFETEWLTMVTEDCVDDLHQALLPYEHVVAVIVRRQPAPMSVWTLQRSGDATRMSYVTSLGSPTTPPLSRRRLLPNLSQGLSGRTLRVVVMQRSYFVMKVDGQYKGVLVDLLQELCNRLNFSYTLHDPVDDSWGQELDNGQWDGAIGMLTRQEVDLGVGTFSETLERSAVVDATTAFHYDHARLLFRQSQPQPNPWTFYILPFQPPVYFVIVVCLLVTFALLLAVRFCRCVGEDEKQEEGSAGGSSCCCCCGGAGGGGGGRGNERKGFDHSLQTDRWTESEGLEESTQQQQQQQQQQQAATRYAQDSEGSDEVAETRGWLGKPESGSHGDQDFGLRSQGKDRGERTTAHGRNVVAADKRRPAGQRDQKLQGQRLDGIALTSEEDMNVLWEDLGNRWKENGEQREDPQDTAAGVRGKSVTEWLLDNLETLLAGLVNRPQEYDGGSGAGRVLVCSWLLLNVVLAAFYSSKLTATLTVKSKEPPFTSLAQLVRQDTYTWGIASGTAKSSILRTSSNKDHRKFYHGALAFAKSDARVTSPDLEVQKEKVLRENYVFFTGSSDLYDEWHGESCDVTMISAPLLTTRKVFYLQKGSPYTRILSDQIALILETGLMTYWKNRWSPGNPRCGDVSGPRRERGDDAGTVTSLKDIQSAFYLSAIGLGVASLALVVEVLSSLLGAARARRCRSVPVEEQ